jgi:dienelactone hydrolase
MTLPTFGDEARIEAERQIVRLDACPDGSARARVTSPALLGIADHRHAGRWWRDLRLDESACGLAAQRAQPTSIVIEHRDDRWPLPVRGLLGCGLAWHPVRPLVAGLAVSGAQARPWVADYAERNMRIFGRVRAATSLTGLDRSGGSPLCWRDEHSLVFLAPRPRESCGPARDEPLVYEAAGPGFVSFEPGLEELLAATGVAISLLQLGDEAVRTLTGALLVRRLQAHAGGLLVQHAAGLRDGAGGHRGLVWSTAALDLRARPATLHACADRVVAGPAPPQPPPTTTHGAPAAAPPEAGPRLSSSSRLLPVRGAAHPARLAVFPRPATDGPAATLLWIRACRGPLDGDTPVAAPLPDSGTAAAILDLPLHWPADATRGLLHDQIVAAVRAGAEALDEDRIDGGRRRPIVVGGHSFGATLALYALAHVRGLAGAIAHSGCYNRTHTPFGFQYERRRYWDAPDVYTAFSALAFADRLAAPVLIVHGLEDANAATHPDQAADLYRAIVATGGTARLVLLPREEHNFRYRETHARLARIQREWLQRAATATATATAATDNRDVPARARPTRAVTADVR